MDTFHEDDGKVITIDIIYYIACIILSML